MFWEWAYVWLCVWSTFDVLLHPVLFWSRLKFVFTSRTLVKWILKSSILHFSLVLPCWTLACIISYTPFCTESVFCCMLSSHDHVNLKLAVTLLSFFSIKDWISHSDGKEKIGDQMISDQSCSRHLWRNVVYIYNYRKYWKVSRAYFNFWKFFCGFTFKLVYYLGVIL